MKRNVWTPERTAALILLYEAGAGPRHMAAFFGKSRDAILIRMRVLRLRVSCDCACGSPRGSREDGKCSWCRNGWLIGASRHQIPWKPEWDTLVRRQLAAVQSRKDYSRALRYIERVTGVPRPTVKTHIYLLGLGMRRGPKTRPWTETEEAYLQESAGTATVMVMAKHLNRSISAVHNRLHALKLSALMTEGYSQQDIAGLLGVDPRSVRKWQSYQWLKGQLAPGDRYRFSDAEVRRFIGLHSEEYDLRLVDQAWFKGMLFPNTFGITRRGPTRHAIEMEMMA